MIPANIMNNSPGFNYLKQIKAFWKLIPDRPELSSSSIALYVALLEIANRNRNLSFKAKREEIITLCRLDKNTVSKHRNTLVKCGLIQYDPGANGQVRATYSLKNLYFSEGEISDTVFSLSEKSDSEINVLSEKSDSEINVLSEKSDSDQTVTVLNFRPCIKVLNTESNYTPLESGVYFESEKNHTTTGEGFLELSKEDKKNKKSENWAVSEISDSGKKHRFSQSPYFNFEFFQSEFEKDEKYACFSTEAIYEELKNASEQKPELVYVNWLATARSWANREPKKYDKSKFKKDEIATKLAERHAARLKKYGLA